MEAVGAEIYDSHLHIIAPGFPLYENQGFLPDFYTIDDYRSELNAYTLLGGAVVSGSFQRQDQSYLIQALKALGPNFVGVTQLLADTPDQQILSLHESGVRAVRFNLRRGGSEDIAHISAFAQRIYALAGWHVELYVDSSSLDTLYKTLVDLPCVVIDHLGLSGNGFNTLLKLAEKGVKVKATGFGRVDFNIEEALKALYGANPDCLMFGTDLPSTRAPRRFKYADITTIVDTLGERAATKVLSSNAQKFYLKRL